MLWRIMAISHRHNRVIIPTSNPTLPPMLALTLAIVLLYVTLLHTIHIIVTIFIYVMAYHGHFSSTQSSDHPDLKPDFTTNSKTKSSGFIYFLWCKASRTLDSHSLLIFDTALSVVIQTDHFRSSALHLLFQFLQFSQFVAEIVILFQC